jgi:hypothetical protein
MYRAGTPSRTRSVHPVRVYILKVYLFFLSFFSSKHTYMAPMAEDRERDEAFLRAWTLPEEDRGKYTSQPWNGEYRWFRSPNIVCLEQYRRTLRAPKVQSP